MEFSERGPLSSFAPVTASGASEGEAARFPVDGVQPSGPTAIKVSPFAACWAPGGCADCRSADKSEWSRGTSVDGRLQPGRTQGWHRLENTSNWNYKRDRNVANYAAPNVRNCSLQVVRNAGGNPVAE